MHPVAIYHFSAQIISRRTGRSSTAAAAYRAGEIVLDENTGEIHDYTRKRGVIRTEILAPRGSPSWVFDRSQLWRRVELGENRRDSQVCREIEISIPHELTILQGQLLMIGFVQSQFVAKGMVADVAFHRPSGDERNFHAHVMLTMRKVQGEGFAKKERDWNSNALLEQWREQWALHANRALEQAGHAARIDHRSHAERGLRDVPGSHHGPAVAGLLARGAQSHMADRVAEQAAALLASQVLDAQAAAELLEAQAAQALADLAAELEIERVQAAAERAAEARAREEAAERAQAAEQAMQAAEAAQRAVEAQRQAAEREEAQRQAAERLQAAQAAERALAEREAAQRAVDAAERARQVLWPAYDQALAGQREAGAAGLQGLLATARAIPKIGAWQRAIDAYETALGVLAKAQAVLAQAGRAVAAALARLEAVDPATREAREARERANQRAYDDQQRRIAQASAAAAAAAARGRQRGSVVTAHHQVQGPQEDDQERDAPDVPRM
jgi:tetratricopeptide (TPR) repeat protein